MNINYIKCKKSSSRFNFNLFLSVLGLLVFLNNIPNVYAEKKSQHNIEKPTVNQEAVKNNGEEIQLLEFVQPGDELVQSANWTRRNSLYLEADGKMRTPQGTFDSVADWFASRPFKRDYPLCSIESRTQRAKHRHALTNRTPVISSVSDCTLSHTNIETEYALFNTKLIVPVVFHVLMREDGTGHLTNEQILSQVEILNEDFGAQPDTPGDGGPLSQNVRIQFVLAGINRHENNNWFNDPVAFEEDFKQALHWDVDNFLNIYTVSPNSLGLGWAYYPQDMAGVPEFDGVVLDFTTVGRDAPGGPQYQGRTATHEVGHYFGLMHTFHPNDDALGISGVCEDGWSAGDLIQSTSAQPEATFDCPRTEQLCNGPAPSHSGNVHNYMNYTDDSCQFYFDIQQVNRATCGLVNYRPDLYVSVPYKAQVKSFVARRAGESGPVVGTIYMPNVALEAGSQFYLGGMPNVRNQITRRNVRARVWTRINGENTPLAQDVSSGLTNPAFVSYTIPSRLLVSYSVRSTQRELISYSGFVVYVPD